MSFMAMEWARTAPVANATERAILIELAHRANDDGTDAFPAKKRMAEVAVCHAKTVQDNLTEMRRRGLIQRGNQDAAYYLPAHARPVVYDLQIPVAWYSKEQLAKVNQDRADKGLGPLTSDNRPQLGEAPKRKHPLKGQPRPPRKSERESQNASGDNDDEASTRRGEQYAPGEHDAPREHEAPKGGAQSSPGGEHDAPRTCPLNPSYEPVPNSSSSAPPPQSPADAGPGGEEDEETPSNSPADDSEPATPAGEPRSQALSRFWSVLPNEVTPNARVRAQQLDPLVWDLLSPPNEWGDLLEGPELLADWLVNNRLPRQQVGNPAGWLRSQLRSFAPSGPDGSGLVPWDHCPEGCDENHMIPSEGEDGSEQLRRCPNRHLRSGSLRSSGGDAAGESAKGGSLSQATLEALGMGNLSAASLQAPEGDQYDPVTGAYVPPF